MIPAPGNKEHSLSLTPKEHQDRNDIEKQLVIIYDALESTINGIIITDIEGRIKYANASFMKMFEYKDKKAFLNKLAADLFVTNKIKKFSDVEAIINGVKGETEEFLVTRKDGSTFHVEVSSSTITDKKGKPAGRMASFSDITERKMTETENIRLSMEIMRSEERERQRISQDLHDSIAQTLHAAKLNFIAYQKDPVSYADRFKVGLEFLDSISQELREVCDDLYPSILEDHGLEIAVKRFARDYLEVNNISPRINFSLKRSLSHDLKINLYRIVKELFSNVVKHSKADILTMDLSGKGKMITLKIEDNGKGFNLKQMEKKKGFGLFSIKQRVEGLGGQIMIESEKNRNTKITINIGIE